MKDSGVESCLLKQIEKKEIKAKKFGFYWEHFHQLFDQIQSECIEIQQAWDNQDMPNLEEEIGDLIQAAVSLAVFCKLDPRQTLLKSIDKFDKRYEAVVKLAQQDGLENLHGQSFDKLIHYWSLAKKGRA